MKIICIGTLDKFSRFFLKLRKELNSYNKTELYVHSTNASGFLYTLLRLKYSSWISVKSWILALRKRKQYLEIIKSEANYKSINFEQLIKYHLNLNKSISKKNLLLQCLAYIDLFESSISKISPDLIILIGDSRLSNETCMKVAQKHKIKTYFVEQGPFNTTVFDEKGVNANASIRHYKTDTSISLEEISEIKKILNQPKPQKYRRSPFYRGIDLCLDFFLNRFYIYPPDLKNTDTYPSFSNTSITTEKTWAENKTANKFLLILQIPMDVNMVYHSPYFKSHFEIVTKVHKSLPDNSELIIREHPLYKNKYENTLYKYCETEKINFDYSKNLKLSLEKANVIIVNNSTVGIEAISLRKTVVALGNSYYDDSDICLKYSPKIDLKTLLQKALDHRIDNKKVNNFLNEFLLKYLVQGFITDKELIAAKEISKKLIT